MDLGAAIQNVSKKQLEDPIVMYLIVNKALNMSPGKIASQVGHAVELITMQALKLSIDENDNFGSYSDEELLKVQTRFSNYGIYKSTGFTKIVLNANPEQWKIIEQQGGGWGGIMIVDEGRTEIPPNSETVIGFFPMRKSEALEIIKKLKLL